MTFYLERSRSLWKKSRSKPDENYNGKITTGEAIGYMPVGFGTSGVIVELWWKNDWTKYPTSDLDLAVAWFEEGDPDPPYEFVAGGSLRSPEGVFLDNSNLVSVHVLLFGYETYGATER